MTIEQRAKEISEFLNVDYNYALERLSQGFHMNHFLVAKDFNDHNTDVKNPDSLINWYRSTDSYIWELSAYHLEPGFNYSGMCEGIATHISSLGKKKVLSLGDGIGDLSIRLAEENLEATYHDLEGGKTAGYAIYRFSSKKELKIKTLFTDNWEPKLGSNYFDAVIALDFFEHLVNVEDWVIAVFNCLTSGGVFMAQNAFAIGDEEHGNSIPMHLSVNNKYETEWRPLLEKIGFIFDEKSGWFIKP